MPNNSLVLILAVTLTLMTVLLLGVLVLWWRLGRGESSLELTQNMTDRLHQLQEKITSAQIEFGQIVQQALQTGRQEQQTILQDTVRALEARFGELRTQVDANLSQTVNSNRQDLAQVNDRLLKLHEATGQIVSLSKGIHDLHTLLKTPSQRGAFGEWALERILEDVLGPEGAIYKRQHPLKSGERADIAIVVSGQNDQVVCVDSKFPSTSAEKLLGDLPESDRANSERQFSRDVLNHAKTIADKYIQPPETLDFAFLFVPTESIFQLLLAQRELHEKLLHMNVIPTSPNSLYAYLQALAYAWRGIRIQESAQEVQQQVHALSGHFEKLINGFQTLGNHLRNASNKYEDTHQDVFRFQSLLARINTIQPGSESNDAHKDSTD